MESVEKDPSGRDLKEPGAKADDGKISVARGCLHYFPRAITAVAELSQIGAKKYSWKGWQDVPDGIHRYGDALARHELRIEDDYSRRDRDTGVLEATAVCWNALARLELVLREQEKQAVETAVKCSIKPSSWKGISYNKKTEIYSAPVTALETDSEYFSK